MPVPARMVPPVHKKALNTPALVHPAGPENCATLKWFLARMLQSEKVHVSLNLLTVRI